MAWFCRREKLNGACLLCFLRLGADLDGRRNAMPLSKALHRQCGGVRMLQLGILEQACNYCQKVIVAQLSATISKAVDGDWPT